ncbi:hypothetical protein [Thiohalorhabdus methylotrophus]|uniref:Uncharacterized protein n=1 Tax=Thiohalorhabdus methylotrophus TaxID=3242694 RepID=A0ABV4TXR4_9GAMM
MKPENAVQHRPQSPARRASAPVPFPEERRAGKGDYYPMLPAGCAG